MNKETKNSNHLLEALIKDGKQYYHILDYTHEEIDDMLARLDAGGVLTQEERNFLDKNKLTKFSTFTGSYVDLHDKPDIPQIAKEVIEQEYDLIDRTRLLETRVAEHDDEFVNVHTELDTKFDSARIQKSIKNDGSINFFFGTMLDEVINLGKPIDYDKLSEEDYKNLSVNINCVESKAPEFDEYLNAVFCNGTLAVIEESSQDFITVSWIDIDNHSITVPADVDIYAGGNGLECPAHYPATGLIIKSGSLKNVYGGSLGEGNVGFTNILINNGSVLTLTGGGQSVYKLKSHKNHVGKSHIILNGGTVETMFAGSQGNGVVNQAVFNMNDGTINHLTAGGESGTTFLSELNINGGTIKKNQGVNRGHVGCITYNLTGGNIELFYAGGEPRIGSVDGTYDHCRLFIDGTEFKYNPLPGTNNRKENNTYISGYIAEYYITDLKINNNNIKNLNLKTREHISREEFSKIETEMDELIAELDKENNKFNISKIGHEHSSTDITDLVETVQSLIEDKIVSINLDKYAIKEEVKASIDSINDLINSLVLDVNSLKGEDEKLNNTLNNITTRINRMESDISDLETAVNYRTTNEDIDEIMANLLNDTMTLGDEHETGE